MYLYNAKLGQIPANILLVTLLRKELMINECFSEILSRQMAEFKIALMINTNTNNNTAPVSQPFQSTKTPVFGDIQKESMELGIIRYEEYLTKTYGVNSVAFMNQLEAIASPNTYSAKNKKPLVDFLLKASYSPKDIELITEDFKQYAELNFLQKAKNASKSMMAVSSAYY